MASIRVVGVVGAGQMGSGIAQVAAAANMQVIMADVDDAALGRGMRAISSSLSRFVKKQSLSQVPSILHSSHFPSCLPKHVLTLPHLLPICSQRSMN
jgi:3-hydroxyacyl-CoA dehydrogenase